MKQRTKNILLAFWLVLVASLIPLHIRFAAKKTKVEPAPRVITLSNTDTIYQEIEKIKLKSTTIIINHDKEVNNYNNAPITDKVELFAKRINR
jgi:hypothetical protein